MAVHRITEEAANLFATCALAHVTREFPNKTDHVLTAVDERCSPRDLHPIFFGSFDWHSCVHSYWLLCYLYRTRGSISCRSAIEDLFDIQISADNVSSEMRYFRRPSSSSFSRPYGWAWLLKLSAELSRINSEKGRRWSAILRPLADELAAALLRHFRLLHYPARVGTHPSSAFSAILALEYVRQVRDERSEQELVDCVLRWFGGDKNCQVWEPSGYDFLSPALVEVLAMSRVLSGADFLHWLNRFLPYLLDRAPSALFAPATVTDSADPHIGHLHGLNLTRAWCWNGLASAAAVSHPLRDLCREVAQLHLDASLDFVQGDYMREHWLATFAALALEVF